MEDNMLIKQVIGFHGIVFLLFHYPEKKNEIESVAYIVTSQKDLY